MNLLSSKKPKEWDFHIYVNGTFDAGIKFDVGVRIWSDNTWSDEQANAFGILWYERLDLKIYANAQHAWVLKEHGTAVIAGQIQKYIGPISGDWLVFEISKDSPGRIRVRTMADTNAKATCKSPSKQKFPGLMIHGDIYIE